MGVSSEVLYQTVSSFSLSLSLFKAMDNFALPAQVLKNSTIIIYYNVTSLIYVYSVWFAFGPCIVLWQQVRN